MSFELTDTESAQPIIMTLQLDAQSAAFFEEQRQQYFPSMINHIGAHLTLFHNLPGEEFENVLKRSARICANQKPFEVTVSELMKLGRGVAYRIESHTLIELRDRLVEQFKPWLIKQDRQKFRPHITVQNKVSPAKAAALYEDLSSGFEPFTARAEGLQLWFYEGGHNRRGTWAPAGAIGFQ